jgi:hypothetical protein
MSGGYNPKVTHPGLVLISNEYQTPFFFGGSQVPYGLHLAKGSFNGAKGEGFHKGSTSKTKKGDYDFTTKSGSKVFHRRGHNIKLPNVLPFMK